MVLLTYTHPTGLVATFEATGETFAEVLACLDQFDGCSARLSTVARLVHTNTTVTAETPLGTIVVDEFGARGRLVSRSSHTRVLVGPVEGFSKRSDCVAYRYDALSIPGA